MGNSNHAVAFIVPSSDIFNRYNIYINIYKKGDYMSKTHVDYAGHVFESDGYYVKVLHEIEPIRHPTTGNIKYRRYRCLCKCGQEFDAQLPSLQNGSTTSCGCRKYESAKKDAEALIGRKYENEQSWIEVVSIEHQGTSGKNTKMRCRCKCGKEFVTNLASLKQDVVHSCGCAKRRRSDDIVGQVFFGDTTSVTVLKELPPHTYPNGTHATRVLCRCSCGNQFPTLAKSVKSGETRSCGCGKGKKNIIIGNTYGDEDYFVQVLQEVDPFVRPGGGKERAFLCRCKCGNEVVLGLRSLERESVSCGCKTIDYNNRTGDPLGNIYGYLQPIKRVESVKTHNGADSQYLCKCLNCGTERVFRRRYLQSGHATHCGCMRLISRGESKIRELLESIGIEYEIQKTMDTCINPDTGVHLRFDFWLSELDILIEFDGEQHFNYKKNGWNTEEKFRQAIYRDMIKNYWADEKHQVLLRIPFCDFDSLDVTYLNNAIKFAKENARQGQYLTFMHKELYDQAYQQLDRGAA